MRHLSCGVRGLRIGIDATYSETGCDPEIIATVREARKVLEDLGAAIKEVKVPNPEAVMAAWGLAALSRPPSPMTRPIPRAPQSI